MPDSTAPQRSGLVLRSLILVAAVANLNLSVANVALPDIGKALRLLADDAEPDRGRLLARPRPPRCSTWARSGHRYGRKLLLLLGASVMSTERALTMPVLSPW